MLLGLLFGSIMLDAVTAMFVEPGMWEDMEKDERCYFAIGDILWARNEIACVRHQGQMIGTDRDGEGGDDDGRLVGKLRIVFKAGPAGFVEI